MQGLQVIYGSIETRTVQFQRSPIMTRPVKATLMPRFLEYIGGIDVPIAPTPPSTGGPWRCVAVVPLGQTGEESTGAWVLWQEEA
jgi:hypothetical protein